MIQINNVSKVHHRGDTEVHALRGLSCQIEEGSFNFIVGPSGSGKSSLLYLIGALDEPTGGELIVGDQKLSAMTPQERDLYRRQQVGFIFQSFNLLANLNAVENVLVPFLPSGVSDALRENAIDVLKRVGLGDRLCHRPNQLSGGEQQRVAVARALLKQPSLVLADEPTGELDSKTGAEVFGYLRRLHEQQKATVIVVTHEEQYFSDTDRILRLRDGQLADSDGS